MFLNISNKYIHIIGAYFLSIVLQIKTKYHIYFIFLSDGEH